MRSRETPKVTEISEYKSIHKWLNRHFKKINCGMCGRINMKLDWANVSGIHRRDRADYMSMCRPCHKRMDAYATCKRGHVFSSSNTYVTPAGVRQCRTCRKQYAAQYERTRGRIR